jgi:hypothetical protein
MQAADELYRPGPYWAGYCSRIYRELRKRPLHDLRRRLRLIKGLSEYGFTVYDDLFWLFRRRVGS